MLYETQWILLRTAIQAIRELRLTVVKIKKKLLHGCCNDGADGAELCIVLVEAVAGIVRVLAKLPTLSVLGRVEGEAGWEDDCGWAAL